jgi:hypothetical protein
MIEAPRERKGALVIFSRLALLGCSLRVLRDIYIYIYRCNISLKTLFFMTVPGFNRSLLWDGKRGKGGGGPLKHVLSSFCYFLFSPDIIQYIQSHA